MRVKSPKPCGLTRTRREEHAEQTRADLLDVAEGLFGQRGYAAVALDEIAAAARVTKGALYHHFKDKRELFHAVVEGVVGNLSSRLRASHGLPCDSWEQLHEICHAYLDGCADPQFTRIVILDAPSVLGWKTWCQIDHAYGLGGFEDWVASLSAAGLVEPTLVPNVAQLIRGALDNGIRLISVADEPAAARAQVELTLQVLLSGLRANAR